MMMNYVVECVGRWNSEAKGECPISELKLASELHVLKLTAVLRYWKGESRAIWEPLTDRVFSSKLYG